jgi:hypothetical protein
MYFSFDSETMELVNKLGYIPKGCYCCVENAFIPEHAEKNKKIVMKERKRDRFGNKSTTKAVPDH